MRALLPGSIALMSVLLCWLVPGCRGTDSLSGAYAAGEGAAKVYRATPQFAYDLALRVLRWEGATALEEHRSELRLLARFPAEAGAHEPRAGVWIEAEGLAAAKVTVISAAAAMSEPAFHRSFAEAMALAESGRPLPAERSE